jgi:Fe-S cluster assembly ATP-binding protein
MLIINNLTVSVKNKTILSDLSCTLVPGNLYALVGVNGSGKSSLAFAIMGHPEYHVDEGSIIFNSHDITQWEVDARARAGIFLAFQTPVEIPGLSVRQLLWHATQARFGTITPEVWQEQLENACALVDMPRPLLERGCNEGFSGGERKRLELLQMCLLSPAVVILDEIDSGLDAAMRLRVVAIIDHLRTKNPQLIVLAISHYRPFIDALNPTEIYQVQEGTLHSIERTHAPYPFRDLQI